MTLTIGLLIPLLGTMIGSAFVFFMRGDMSIRLQKALLGFASGVMVAASIWSLLIPAMEMEAVRGSWSVLPAAIGFLMGMGFLLLIDELTPHLHLGTDKPEGIRSHLSRTTMLAIAVTIHNLPEGMAVGVVFAGAESSVTNISLTSAIAVALGIAARVIGCLVYSIYKKNVPPWSAGLATRSVVGFVAAKVRFFLDRQNILKKNCYLRFTFLLKDAKSGMKRHELQKYS